jgi:UPF0042 nucleotide-binding protein
LNGPDADRHLVLITGLSGGGKSTALHAIEDLGYYCVDNLPAALLPEFATQIKHGAAIYARVALGVDARSPEQDLREIPAWLEGLSGSGIDCRMLFLDADSKAIIKRFSETRRRHPLTSENRALPQAIEREIALLAGLRQRADFGYQYPPAAAPGLEVRRRRKRLDDHRSGIVRIQTRRAARRRLHF